MFKKNYQFILYIVLFLLLFTTACQLLSAPVGVVPTPAVSTSVVVVPTTAVVATTEFSATLPAATVTAGSPAGEPAAAPTTGSAAPTAVTVLDTNVQYIIALGDLNVRSGPGTGYQIVSALRKDQTATVTGISSDSGWWKIQCPAGVAGSCWATAGIQYTKPSTAPVSQPPATAAPAACTDAATFVADVSVPDGTHYLPDALFTKTWRVKNSGTCTWDKNYAIAFKNGDRLGSAYDAYALSGSVVPGATVDIGIKMQAPRTAGSFQGNWELRNAKGGRFGVGRSNVPLWVKIVVDGPSSGTSAISGTMWQDTNMNNVLDANEVLPNMVIILFTGSNCTQQVTSTRTDANGRYSFSNLPAGSYCVIGADEVAYLAQVNVMLNQNQTVNNANLQWLTDQWKTGAIVGRVYQDKNGNGTYDNGDVSVGLGRELWLMRGTCEASGALVVQAFTRDDGRYAFHEVDPGTYCVGLKSANGMEDVRTVTIAAREAAENIDLRTAVAASIAGWLWNDYCFARAEGGGTVLDGTCVEDGNGGYRANGVPDTGEGGLSGVTLRIQAGSCATDNPTTLATAVTDGNGQYMFRELGAGTYCVFMNAAESGNGSILLPGDWTYPARGIWYSQVTVYAGEQRTGVNFGWDYQLQ